MKFKKFFMFLLALTACFALVGCTGEQGIQGIQGDKGEKGDQGVQGEQGEKGEQGAQGAQGEQGVQGEKGDKGDKGDNGVEVEFRIFNGVLQQKYTNEDDSAWKDVINLVDWGVWARRYEVKLDAKGGEFAKDATTSWTDQIYQTELELPAPTKANYEFAGWTDGKEVFTTTYKIADDVTLEATWVAIKYAVTFDSNGGSEVKSEVAADYDAFAAEMVELFKNSDEKDSVVTTKENFQGTTHPNIKGVFNKKENLDKYSWFITYMLEDMKATCPEDKASDAYYTDTIAIVERMVAGDTTAIVDGTNGPNARTAIRNYIHRLINKCNEDANVNKAYNFFTTDYSDETNQNEFSAALEAAKKLAFSVEDKLPVPTLENYYFEGWFDAEDKLVEKVTKEIALKAKWTKLEEKFFDVKFELAGGTLAEAAPEKMNPVTDLPVPTKEGYIFLGWYNAADEKVEKIWASGTYTAKWDLAKVDVKVGEDNGATLYVAPVASALSEGAKLATTTEKELVVGTNVFGTLDAALAKAADNDVIYVTAGTYTVSAKTLTAKNLTIMGPNYNVNGAAERAEEAVLVAGGQTIWTINSAEGLEVNGLTLDAESTNVSWFIGGTKDLAVKNNVFKGYHNSIFKTNGSNASGVYEFSGNHFDYVAQFLAWFQGGKAEGLTELNVVNNTFAGKSLGTVGENGLISIRDGNATVVVTFKNNIVDASAVTSFTTKVIAAKGGTINVTENKFIGIPAGKYFGNNPGTSTGETTSVANFDKNEYLDKEGKVIVLPNLGNASLPSYAKVEINSEFTGGSYITNNESYPNPSFYGNGGLKMNYVNQGILTNKFAALDKVVVSVVVSALNENTKTEDPEKAAYTVYGLNEAGEVVATATLDAVVVGDNAVELAGTGIVQVKVIMTDFPFNGNKACNVNVTGVVIYK